MLRRVVKLFTLGGVMPGSPGSVPVGASRKGFRMEGGKERAMGLPSRERRKRVLGLMAARLCRLGGGESDEDMRISGVPHEQGAEKVGSSSFPRSANNGGGRRREQRRSGASSPSVRRLSSWCLPSMLSPRCKSLEEEGDMVREQAVLQAKGEVGGASPRRREASGGRDGEDATVSSSEAMALSGEGCDPPPVRPGEKPEQTSLGIGMGAGLVFLLARSVTEFKKMTELRSEMEALLNEMKASVILTQTNGVAQKREDAGRRSVEPRKNLAFCSSVSCGYLGWSNELSSVQERSYDPSMEMAEASGAAEIDEHPSGCEAAVGIDQLMEEELQSELELLQMNLDKQEEHSSELLSFEIKFKLYDELDEMPQQPSCASGVCGYADENSVIEDQYPVPPGERLEGDAGGGYGCGGVSPRELMSRLHELVEAQQRERIAELESALQLAHIKLREKETEACWWRDTARLVSEHRQGTVVLHR